MKKCANHNRSHNEPRGAGYYCKADFRIGDREPNKSNKH